MSTGICYHMNFSILNLIIMLHISVRVKRSGGRRSHAYGLVAFESPGQGEF